MNAELLRELRKASPNTAGEWIWCLILLLVGIVILLNPDSIFGISGIDRAEILDLPGVVGITVLFGSPLPVLLTQAYNSLNSES